MRRISPTYRDQQTLPDGRVVYFRAIRPDDRDKLQEAFHRLSPSSVRDRFFNMKLDLTPKELTFFTEVDFRRHVALVAELANGTSAEAVAVGRFVCNREQPDHCEFAITVADEFQGRGIGKLMLWQLVHGARDLGIDHFDASVLPDNTRMTRLLHNTGLPLESKTGDGVLTYSLDIRPTAAA